MPRSKRDKKVSLTQTVKKGLVFRQQLAEEVKKCTEDYSCIFIFTTQNMRNGKLKDLRKEWKHSRFFFGKNKVMAYGLGRNPSVEVQKNIHKLTNELKGQCGLLFTNKPKEEVVEWFRDYYDNDFARTGDIATDTVILQAGPLSQFPHMMEPHLKQQGLPVALERGVVTLIKDYTVCKKAEILTPEQARILKLLDNRMAVFKLNLRCVWTNDGNFQLLSGERRNSGETAQQPENNKPEEDEIEMDDEEPESDGCE